MCARLHSPCPCLPTSHVLVIVRLLSMTALMWAAEHADKDAMVSLILHGADMDITDRWGYKRHQGVARAARAACLQHERSGPTPLVHHQYSGRQQLCGIGCFVCGRVAVAGARPLILRRATVNWHPSWRQCRSPQSLLCWPCCLCGGGQRSGHRERAQAVHTQSPYDPSRPVQEAKAIGPSGEGHRDLDHPSVRFNVPPGGW